MFGADRTEKGYLENSQQSSIRNLQVPVAVLAFLHSPHLNAGMKQYECGRTQPLLRMGQDGGKTSVSKPKGLRQILMIIIMKHNTLSLLQ